LFPETDGALPWANTNDGDVAYWLTEHAKDPNVTGLSMASGVEGANFERGTPDKWLVAVWNPRSGREPSLHEGAVAWISSWIEASDSRWFDP
jgi:hypothetical protein